MKISKPKHGMLDEYDGDESPVSVTNQELGRKCRELALHTTEYLSRFCRNEMLQKQNTNYTWFIFALR